MSDLRDLYQEVILDHGRSPRNFGPMPDANRESEGDNPLCGDHITVRLYVDESDIVRDVRFEGHGCAISIASASLMSEFVKGKPTAEAKRAFAVFHDMVMGAEGDPDVLDKLIVLAGVKDYPMRVKCATLAWHTMNAALADSHETVTTE